MLDLEHVHFSIINVFSWRDENVLPSPHPFVKRIKKSTSNSVTQSNLTKQLFQIAGQCSEPNTQLTESWRKVKYTPGGASSCNRRCDGSLQAGWYRFLEPAGTKLPIAPPASYGNRCDVCQTSISAWVEEGRHPDVEEGVINVKFCFAWDGRPCYHANYGKVVACEESDGYLYYLYYLPRYSHCNNAYCALV